MTDQPAPENFTEAVDDSELVSLLQQMVRIRSYSDGGEEGNIARFMEGYLGRMGLEVELQEVQPGRFNVVARLPGTGGAPSLMFNGHMDTNPVGEGWSRDPLGGDVDNQFIYGIGVANMKAADAAYLAAVQAVMRSGIKLRGDVILALVVGELQGGVGTVYLVGQGVRADRFVVGEPTDLSLLTLHAGSLEAEVIAKGETRHLSKMEEGVDAIALATKAMARIRIMKFSGADRADHRGVQRVNIGIIRGGIGPDYQDWRAAMVADRCSFKFSVRYSPAQTVDGVMADIRGELEGLQAEEPGFRFELRLNDTGQRIRMGPFEVGQQSDIVQCVRAAHHEIVGKEPNVGDVAPYKFYGTDASHLAAAGMSGVVYGPGGKYNTMPDERVELKDLFHAARVYARTIVNTCL